MKKLFLVLIVSLTVVACGSDKASGSKTNEAAPMGPGPDNVDGNVPDTTSTIQLNKPLPQDSSLVKDSAGQ